MNLRILLQRGWVLCQSITRDPLSVLRSPAFVRRAFIEGRKKTLMRLREITSIYRFVQNYDSWRQTYHDATEDELVSMRIWANKLINPPLISVLMPVYNPNAIWLEEAIKSVKKQSYPYWELCIADDCSTDPKIAAVLEEQMLSDSRIRVSFRLENGHICKSSNTALELIRGDWVALMDHDDLLPADALAWVAHTILEQPHLRLIYSDEDKISEDGVRFGPYFKPDWNQSLIESQNFFSHLGVYHADLLRQVGGFRIGLEGSQDYDLLLRCLDVVGGDAVGHIPRVLYHWRVHAESTSSGNDAKPYAVTAAEHALNDRIRRQGIEGKAWATKHGYRIQRFLKDSVTEVAVLFDARGLNERQIYSSLLSLKPIVDIADSVKLGVYLVLDADDHLLQDQFNDLSSQFGWKIICERQSSDLSTPEVFDSLIVSINSEFLLLWDGRLRAPSSVAWLVELISQLQVDGVAAVGPKLTYSNRKISHAGLVLSSTQLAAPLHRLFDVSDSGYWGRANLLQNFSALPLPGLLLRREAVESCGGLLSDSLLLPHWGLTSVCAN